MTDIYVPLDYSPLKSVIPPGEDIIDSSLAQAVAKSGNYTAKWLSHVLLTPKSFAYTRPKRRKAPELECVPLYTVWLFVPEWILYKKLVRFQFRRDPNFETKETFLIRTIEFAHKFIPYLLEAKRERLKEMEADSGEFKAKEIKKMYNKVVEVEKRMIGIERKYEKKMEKLKKKGKI